MFFVNVDQITRLKDPNVRGRRLMENGGESGGENCHHQLPRRARVLSGVIRRLLSMLSTASTLVKMKDKGSNTYYIVDPLVPFNDLGGFITLVCCRSQPHEIISSLLSHTNQILPEREQAMVSTLTYTTCTWRKKRKSPDHSSYVILS